MAKQFINSNNNKTKEGVKMKREEMIKKLNERIREQEKARRSTKRRYEITKENKEIVSRVVSGDIRVKFLPPLLAFKGSILETARLNFRLTAKRRSEGKIGLKVHTLMKKDSLITKTHNFKILSLDILENKENDIDVKAFTEVLRENVMLHKNDIITDTNVKIYNKCMEIKTKDNFIDKFISVTMDSQTKLTLESKDLCLDTVTGKVYVHDTIKDLYTDLSNRKVTKEIPEDVITYRMMAYTSGGVKKTTAIYAKTTIIEDGNVYLNMYTAGAYDAIMRKHKRGLNQSTAVKFASRPMLAFSPNTAAGKKLERIDILTKTSFDMTEYKDGKPNNTSDGQVYLSAKFVSEWLGLPEDKAVNVILQARIYGVVKFQAIVVPHELLVEMVNARTKDEGYDTKGNRDIEPQMFIDDNAIKVRGIDLFVNTDSVTLSIMAIGKLSDGGYTSKQLMEKVLVAISDMEKEEDRQFHLKELESFFKNGLKREYKRVVDMVEKYPFADETYALEILKSMAPNNPVVGNKVKSDLVYTLAKMVDKIKFRITFEEKYTDEEGNVKIKDVDAAWNAVVAGDICAIFNATGIIRKGEVVFGKVSKMLRTLEDKIEKAKTEEEEIEAQKELDKYEAKYKKGIGIKYPSMGFKEYASFKVLSINEVIRRIGKHKGLTTAQKRGLVSYFKNMSDATVMFPALREVFMTCAGMDTDFDKILLIFHKLIVNTLYGKEEALLIDTEPYVEKSDSDHEFINYDDVIPANEKNGEKLYNVYDPNFMWEMFMAQTKEEGTIGKVTYYNNRVVAILAAYKLAKPGTKEEKYIGKTIIDKILEDTVGETQGKNGSYATLMNKKLKITKKDTIVYNEKYVDYMLETMSELKWTRSNRIAFLEDCSRIFRLYQEGTIDAAKTGYYLSIKLTIETVEILSLLKVYNDNGNIRRATLKKETAFVKPFTSKPGEKAKEREVICFRDILGELQETLITEITDKHNGLIAQINEKYAAEYTKDEVEDFKNTITRVKKKSKNNAEKIATIFNFKDIYNDIVMNKYIESMKEANENIKDEDLLEKTIAYIKEEFERNLSIIRDSVLIALFDLDIEDEYTKKSEYNYILGKIMLGISLLQRNLKTKDDTGKTKCRFAYAMANNLVLNYYSNSKKKNVYKARLNVLQVNKEEGIVKTNKKGVQKTYQLFVNGISNKGSVVEQDYTGLLPVSDMDDNKELNCLISIPKEEYNKDKTYMIIKESDLMKDIPEDDITIDSYVHFFNGEAILTPDSDTNREYKLTDVKNINMRKTDKNKDDIKCLYVDSVMKTQVEEKNCILITGTVAEEII